MRVVKKVFLFIFLLFIFLIIGCNVWVISSTSDRIIPEISNLPDNRVVLVLGTSHRTTKGDANPFFESRIEAASNLYKNGKAAHFILSGDNETRYYNEPMMMKKALVKKGVPPSAITLDYAGFRTLDSIVRSKEIFGQNELIIITQPFHSYRALFISNFYDINAVAMIIGGPSFMDSPGVRFREYFARLKAVLDLYILRTNPRFLGKKEKISV